VDRSEEQRRSGPVRIGRHATRSQKPEPALALSVQSDGCRHILQPPHTHTHIHTHTALGSAVLVLHSRENLITLFFPASSQSLRHAPSVCSRGWDEQQGRCHDAGPTGTSADPRHAGTAPPLASSRPVAFHQSHMHVGGGRGSSQDRAVSCVPPPPSTRPAGR